MHRTVLRTVLMAAVLLLFLAPAPSVLASPNDPHIVSRADTSQMLRGEVIPHLEITKGWVQPKEDRFDFVLELARLPAESSIPRDSVYVFHYTFDEGRLYWRAHWNETRGGLDFFGGMYVGCQPPWCPIDRSFDDQGNRNYFYMAGNASQSERVHGQVIAGAPGRIVWSYPMAGYGDRLDGLEFKGLFAATYTVTEERALRYADLAVGTKDFLHHVKVPWHAKLRAMIPGPSPVLVGLAVLGLLAVASRRLRAP